MALWRLLEPFCLRLNAFCARRSLARFALNLLGLAIFSPVLNATKLVTPKSIPTTFGEFGNGSISISTNKETVYRPAGESNILIVEGSTPLGNCRLQQIGKACEHLARNTCSSLDLNAGLVNSALPPFRFFLKVGYLACPSKKFENAFCRCISPCCKGTQLTSFRNCKSSCFFDWVSMAEVLI